MKGYFIIPVVVVALGLRLLVRRRRRSSGPSNRPSLRLGRRDRLGKTGIVAGREIHERLRGPLFRVVTLILLLVVVAVIVIPTLSSGTKTPERLGVVGPLTPELRNTVTQVFRSAQVTVHMVTEPSLDAARADLRLGRIDLAIDNGRSVVVDKPIAATDLSAGTQIVRNLATTIGINNALDAAQLSPSQRATLTRAAALPIRSLQPAKKQRNPAQSTSVVGVILTFVMLTQYLTWTLMGVMEEKANRVVEVLLATVRPLQLLGGKLLGIGVVAMLQAGLVVAVALIVAKAAGSSLLKGAAPLVVVSSLVWLVLGYAFYSWVYAAAGSMTERQSQVQSMALPLSIPMIFGYIYSLTTVSSGNPSVFFKVLAFLPPTAPFAMPTLVALNIATWWEFAISVLITIASTLAVARVAAGVYQRMVLRTGGRVRWREVFAT